MGAPLLGCGYATGRISAPAIPLPGFYLGARGLAGLRRYAAIVAVVLVSVAFQAAIHGYAADAMSVPETSVGQCGVYLCIRYRVVLGSGLDSVEWVMGLVLSTNGTLFEERLLFAGLGVEPPVLARNDTIVLMGGNYSYTVLSDRVVASRLIASRIAGLLGSVGYFTIVRNGDNADDVYLLYNVRIEDYDARTLSSGNVSVSVIAVSGYGRVMVASVVGEMLEAAGLGDELPLDPLYVLDTVAAPSSSTVVVLVAYGPGGATLYLEAVYAYPPGLGETVLNHFAEASQGVVTGSMPSYTVVVLYPELRSLLELLGAKGFSVERGLEALDRGLLAQFLAWRSSLCRAGAVSDQYAYAALLSTCLAEPLDPYATIFMLDYSEYVKEYLRLMPDPAALALIPDLVKVVRSLDTGYGLLMVFKPRDGLRIETVVQRVLAYTLAHGAVLLAPAGYRQLDPPIPVEGLDPEPKMMLTGAARILLEALIEGRVPPGLSSAAMGASSPQQVLESIAAANTTVMVEEDLRPPTTPRYQPAVVDGEEDEFIPLPFSYEPEQARPIVIEWPEYRVDMERVRRLVESLLELEETLRGHGLEDYQPPEAAMTPEPLSLRLDPLLAMGALAAPVLALTWRYVLRIVYGLLGVARGILAGSDPVRCYHAVSMLLAAAGYPRRAWEGPWEHCERLPREARVLVEDVVRAYIESKYAGRGSRVACGRSALGLLRLLARRGGGG